MEKKPPSKRPSNAYVKYSSIAFQMIATILIGLFLGKFLDGKFNTYPTFTAILSLLAVVAGIYLSLKDFIKKE